MLDTELSRLLATSAVVAAIVGGLITFLSQQWLLQKKADLDYIYEAKKRLYEAIGPLMLQLLLASRDVVRRFGTHHLTAAWNMNPKEYYVKSCVYRLLAPLAVGQLIERHMSLVDFRVDKEAIKLLSFITSAERMLTGSEVILGHPSVDWSTQSQHLFRDNLRSAANKLVMQEKENVGRLMTFAEFDSSYDLLGVKELRALAVIFSSCERNLLENSLFWARVTGYAFVCAEHLRSRSAKDLGFGERELPIRDMLSSTADEHFTTRLDAYEKQLKRIIADAL